jgi:phage-related protein
MAAAPELKPIIWIGSTRDDLSGFPEDVKDAVGFALFVAQQGGKHPDATPLRGFGGAGVLEIVEDHDGDTYRAIYTVRLGGRIYALHAFQKKSKSGIKTPKAVIELIRARLARAEQQHAAWLRRRGENGDG